MIAETERLHEVLKADGVVPVMLDRDPIRRRVYGAPFREQRRLRVQPFHVGKDRSQNEQAIGFIDELLNLIARNQSTVHADIEGMVLADHRFAQERRGDRHIEPFDEPRQVILQTEPSDFGTGQDRRTLGRCHHGPDFTDRFFKRVRIARFVVETQRPQRGG